MVSAIKRMCLSQQQTELFLMVSHELILYSKKPNLVGKGHTISFYKHIFIFSIHFIQNVAHS